MDNYDLVLNDTLAKLAKFNYAIISGRTGAEFDVETESLKLRFFDKEYVISKERCCATGGDEDEKKDMILIIDYLLSFGSLELGDEWIDFREIPSSMPYDGAFRANVEAVLEAKVPQIIQRKDELIAKYNGYNVRGFESADFAVVFPVFPRVECLVLLYEGDEEIGSGAKVLFSSRAHDFLSTESLAAIAETLTRRLVK